MLALRAILLVLVVAGCSFEKPAVTIVHQTEPSPLRGVREFRLAAVTTDHFAFGDKTEAEWLASRSPAQRDGWENDKAKLYDRIFERLQVEAGDKLSIQRGGGQFAIMINLDRYEEEFGPAHGRFHGTLKVVDASGRTIDEVKLPSREGGGYIALALNTFVTWSAADTVEYLRSRTQPGN